MVVVVVVVEVEAEGVGLVAWWEEAEDGEGLLVLRRLELRGVRVYLVVIRVCVVVGM